MHVCQCFNLVSVLLDFGGEAASYFFILNERGIYMEDILYQNRTLRDASTYKKLTGIG